MPFGGALSLAGAGIGLGSSLAGLIGGTPASQVPTYSYQQPGTADSGAISGIQNLSNYNVSAGLLPQYQSLAQGAQMQNNPYAQQYQQGSVPIGQATTGAGAALTGASLGQLGNVQQLMQMGFDPQNALYNYTQNQNQQQNLAALSQSGLGTTPYGQGVNAMANNQFNMNWENQQLGRASQAAGAAGGLLNNIGQNVGQGTSLMAGGNALPYNASNTITGNSLSALNQAGQAGVTAQGGQQNQIQDYLAYLQGATGQQSANTNTANSVFNQNQALGSQLGGSLASLGNSWGKAFGGGNTFGSTPNYGQNTNINVGGYSMPQFT